MKKILCLTLIAVCLFGLVACSEPAPATEPVIEATEETMPPAEGIAPHPMQRKEYLPANGTNATADELRAIAVELMEDSMSIQWNTDRFIYYSKRVGLTGKKYTFSPGLVFSGIPYTDGSSGLIQWMEFYDTESGLFSYPGTGAELDGILGNSCAGTIISAYNAVCNSMPKAGIVDWVLPSNGLLLVGPYKFPSGVTSLKSYGTDLICQENGQDVMFASYAEILPADILASTPDAHAIMAKEAAHVVYNKDGSINGEESYVIIMDQRAGQGDYFYVEMDGDVELLHSGRLYHKYSFNELWELCYLPMCPAEFKGTDPYEIPEVSYSGATPNTVEDLMKGYVTSNYPIAVTRLTLVAPDGTQTVLSRVLMRNQDISKGKASNVPIMDMAAGLSEEAYLKAVEEGGYKLQVVALLFNGQIFDVAEVPVS